jgi:hypothetical protein
MSRVTRAIGVAAVLCAGWLGMQAVHELGHVTAAWLTGGKVERVVLHPLAISRTDVSPNPRPLMVAWAGPLVGVILPLVVAGVCRLAGRRIRRLADFFAGFCLIANGLYIGAGSFGRIGDAGDMLRHGSPPWTLFVFGVACTAGGLWIWHCLTRRDPSNPA